MTKYKVDNCPAPEYPINPLDPIIKVESNESEYPIIPHEMVKYWNCCDYL